MTPSLDTPVYAVPEANLIPVGDYLGDLVMTGRATRYPELVAGWIEEFLSEETP